MCLKAAARSEKTVTAVIADPGCKLSANTLGAIRQIPLNKQPRINFTAAAFFLAYGCPVQVARNAAMAPADAGNPDAVAAYARDAPRSEADAYWNLTTMAFHARCAHDQSQGIFGAAKIV